MESANKRSGAYTPRKTRVLIVDDHPVVRHGFAQRIGLESDMEVCGQVATAHEALAMIDQLQPDVATIDITLSEGDGLELIKDLRFRGDDVRILVISSLEEDVYAERCLRAGAQGYLHKSEAIDRVVDAIRQLVQGRLHFSDAVTSQTLSRAFAAPGPESVAPMDRFSDRELQVYELLGQGLTVTEIADRLYLSPKTIETYRAHLKSKLHLKSSNELMRHAMRWALERT